MWLKRFGSPSKAELKRVIITKIWSFCLLSCPGENIEPTEPLYYKKSLSPRHNCFLLIGPSSAIVWMFHKLCFACSILSVIFLLPSQEAAAKNDQSGLVLLSPSSYTSDPATQHLLQNMTHRAPANIKHLQAKCAFQDPEREAMEWADAKEKKDKGTEVNGTSSILYQALC